MSSSITNTYNVQKESNALNAKSDANKLLVANIVKHRNAIKQEKHTNTTKQKKSRSAFVVGMYEDNEDMEYTCRKCYFGYDDSYGGCECY